MGKVFMKRGPHAGKVVDMGTRQAQAFVDAGDATYDLTAADTPYMAQPAEPAPPLAAEDDSDSPRRRREK